MGRDTHCVVAFGYIVVVSRNGMDWEDFYEDFLWSLRNRLGEKGLSCLWNDDDSNLNDEAKVFVSVKRKTMKGWEGRNEIISDETVGITAEEISTMKEALTSYKVDGNPQLIMCFYYSLSIEV